MTESSVHIPAETEPATASPRRSSDALWLVLPAVSGVVVGFLWWVLAPGGLNLLSGNPGLANPANPDSLLPRDLVLAGLVLVAGCVTGLFLDGKLQGAGAGRRFVFALAGGAAGAAIAWLVGLFAAQLWGAAPDPSQGVDSGFTLRSYAVFVLWPGAIAFVTFVLALFGVLSGKPVK